MIVLAFIAMAVGILTLGLGLFPCGMEINSAGVVCTSADVFLPLPAIVTTSIATPIGWLKWLVYLPGDDIGNAFVQGLAVVTGGTVIVMLWRALRNVDIPILNRWIH